jgi:hypothetical protein
MEATVDQHARFEPAPYIVFVKKRSVLGPFFSTITYTIFPSVGMYF